MDDLEEILTDEIGDDCDNTLLTLCIDEQIVLAAGLNVLSLNQAFRNNPLIIELEDYTIEVNVKKHILRREYK